VTDDPVITDADAARTDVAALLEAGLGDPGGALRGALQGEGALAAAIQLERADVPVEDVALALSQVHSRTLGIAVTPAPFPRPLDGWLAAAAAEPELLTEWLGLVANLMLFRAAS
jgi:hypothetical protein